MSGATDVLDTGKAGGRRDLRELTRPSRISRRVCGRLRGKASFARLMRATEQLAY